MDQVPDKIVRGLARHVAAQLQRDLGDLIRLAIAKGVDSAKVKAELAKIIYGAFRGEPVDYGIELSRPTGGKTDWRALDHFEEVQSELILAIEGDDDADG